MLLLIGEPEKMKGLPPFVHQAYSLHMRQRVEEAWSLQRTTPRSPALMGAILPAAVGLLEIQSSEDLANELKPYIARVRTITPHVKTRFVESLSFSSRLIGAFDLAWTSMRTKRRPKFGEGRPVAPGAGDPLLRAEDVPQLLWEDVFDDEFAPLMKGISKDHARRVCSMALLRFGGDYTWNSAAQKLGLPGKNNAAKGVAAMVLMGRLGTEELFLRHLRKLAARVVKKSGAIDYGARRRAFSSFKSIDDTDWASLCAAAGVDPHLGQRNRHATAWLWCRVTSGDHRLSPALDGAGRATHKAYRNFIANRTFERLKDPLVIYESALLRNRSF